MLLTVYGEMLRTNEGSYVWTDGRFVRLQPSEPGGYVEPSLLDDWGRAFGTAPTRDGTEFVSPAIWDRRGRVTVLPPPEGSIGSDVRDVNNLGQRVGYTVFTDGTQRIMLWTAGRPAPLPDNTGVSPQGDAVMINDLGQVAWTERSDEDGFSPVGFVWWFGRPVQLGDGTVADIDDIVGYVQPGGNANPTYALHWSVDWRTVFHRTN